MTTDLDRRMQRGGRTLASVADWVAEQLAATWETSWQEHLPMITQAYQRMGEPAYGLYNRELFAPLQQQLGAVGLRCKPPLPGTLPQSEEDWGPEEHRERRMWTLLHDEDGHRLGAIVTRFFHDHTQLRLPAPPTAIGLPATDHDQIRQIIVQDPSTWPTPPPTPRPTSPDPSGGGTA
jgi:hypothetical protein